MANRILNNCCIDNIRIGFIEGAHIRRLPYVTWRLTSKCNSRCFACNFWNSSVLEFPFSRVNDLIKEMAELGTLEILFIGGEPTLHSNFASIVEATHRAGIRTVVFTNGLFENREIANNIYKYVDTLILSIDSYRPQIHNLLRGRDDAFKRTLDSIKFIKRNNRTFIAVNCVISRKNYESGLVFGMIDFAQALGVGYIAFSLMDFRTNEREKPNQATQDARLSFKEFNLYLKEVIEATKSCKGIIIASNPDIRYISSSSQKQFKYYKKGLYGLPIYRSIPCWESWIGINILPNGDLYPCLSTILMPKYRIGNILNNRLTSFINNSSIVKYRLNRIKKPYSICLYCKDNQSRNYEFTQLLEPYRIGDDENNLS